jgi:hypothetical protein
MMNAIPHMHPGLRDRGFLAISSGLESFDEGSYGTGLPVNSDDLHVMKVEVIAAASTL